MWDVKQLGVLHRVLGVLNRVPGKLHRVLSLWLQLTYGTSSFSLRQLSLYRRRPVGGLNCVQVREPSRYILKNRNAICLDPRSCCRRAAQSVRPLLRVRQPPCLPGAFGTPPCGYTYQRSHTKPSQPLGRCVFALVPKISNSSQTERFRSTLGRRPQGPFSGPVGFRDCVRGSANAKEISMVLFAAPVPR